MKTLLLLIILSSILTACKKGGQPPIQNIKGLLVATMTTIAAPDTTVATYSYDDNNRIIKIVNTQTGLFGQFIITYTYDADGDVTSQTSTNGSITDKAIVNYINGQPAFIRSISIVGNDTLSNAIASTITVRNNRVVRMNVNGGANGDTITYIGNNVKTFSPLDGIDPSGNFNYGTKNGPFKNSRFKWVLDLNEGNIFMEFDENDIVNSTGPNPEVFHNTYNTQGYPTQIIFGAGGIVKNFTYMNAK